MSILKSTISQNNVFLIRTESPTIFSKLFHSQRQTNRIQAGLTYALMGHVLPSALGLVQEGRLAGAGPVLRWAEKSWGGMLGPPQPHSTVYDIIFPIIYPAASIPTPDRMSLKKDASEIELPKTTRCHLFARINKTYSNCS